MFVTSHAVFVLGNSTFSCSGNHSLEGVFEKNPHPYQDLTKSGYKPENKVQIFNHPWICVATQWKLHIWISQLLLFFSLTFGDWKCPKTQNFNFTYWWYVTNKNRLIPWSAFSFGSTLPKGDTIHGTTQNITPSFSFTHQTLKNS